MTSRRAALLILVVTAYRILMLALDRTDLFVDEAQYWMWSRALAFGYYSKPPMIAWTIHATTALGGSQSLFWIRLSSPLLHAATAALLIALAGRLTGSDRIAGWTGAGFITLPGVALSSIFISTDTALLFFYALAMLLTVRLAECRSQPEETRTSLPLAGGLGLSIGLGLLSKYAMVYFPATAALAAWRLPQARIGWRHAAFAALLALVVLSPNLIWNAHHGGATLRHTSDNIGWTGLNLHIGKALEFLAAQFGVVGPVLFGAMIVGLCRVARRSGNPVERQLVLLSWPIIGLIVGQALMSRAYANWAATAYVAGIVLATLTLANGWQRGLRASLAINGAVTLALPLLAAFPQTTVPGGQTPILARYLGRSALSETLAARAKQAGLTTIVAGNRDILADLVYTLRDRPFTIRARPTGAPPRNAYEQDMTYDPARDAPRVLLITEKPFACASEETAPLPPIQPTTGYLRGRTLFLSAASARCLIP